MNSDHDEILRLHSKMIQAAYTVLARFAQTDMILIELIQSGEVSPKALAVAARNVESTAHTLDIFGDELRELAPRVQRS